MATKGTTEEVIRDYQSETERVINRGAGRGAAFIIWSVAGLIVGGVVLSMFVITDKDIVSETGKIVASTQLKTIQTLDTALIKTVDVREGDRVKKGDLLATLDPTFAAADAGQLEQQVASLDAQIIRAEAERDGHAPAFPAKPSAAMAPYVVLQTAMNKQRLAQYNAQIASFNEKVAQTEATVQRLEGDQARYQERDKVLKRVEDMRAALVEKAAGSLLNLLNATDSRVELKRTMESEAQQLIEERHLLASQNSDRDAFIQQWHAQLSQEIVTARNSRDDADSKLAKAKRMQELVEIRAGEDSVVLNRSQLSVGSVLKEGDTLMTLAPLDAPVEVELQIDSTDVGYVRRGDPCTIKIDAFEAVAHGDADGRLEWISEGSFTKQDDGQTVAPFYKAHAKITNMNFYDVPKAFRLIPGMTVTTDVHIGARSIFRYLVDGMSRGATNSSMRDN